MWLATQHGFYSIVEKKSGEFAVPQPNVRPAHSECSDERCFHIRARCRKDLENLIALSGLATPIIDTPTGDYGWRLVVGKAEVARVLAALGNAIDYSNFKDRIHHLPDQREKASIYSRLWSQFYTFQSRQKSL